MDLMILNAINVLICFGVLGYCTIDIMIQTAIYRKSVQQVSQAISNISDLLTDILDSSFIVLVGLIAVANGMALALAVIGIGCMKIIAHICAYITRRKSRGNIQLMEMELKAASE